MSGQRREIRSAAVHAYQALAALGETPACPCCVVEMRVDRRSWFAQFRPNREEHLRRLSERVGPAVSTGLLHALWSLPEDLPVERRALTRRDVITLEAAARGFVKASDSAFTRLYRPSGVIEAIVVVSRRLQDATRRAAYFPPIYRRVAVALRPSMVGVPSSTLLGKQVGVGEVFIKDEGSDPVVIEKPQPASLGVPAVYRWWMAELAYRNWLYANCAHWSS